MAILIDERLREWALYQGAVIEDGSVAAQPAGKHVLGDVPLNYAAQAATVTIMVNGEAQTFMVKRVATPRFGRARGLYSIEEAAKALGVSVSRVRAYARAHGVGQQETTGWKRFWFSAEDVERMRTRGKSGRPKKDA